MALEIEDSLKNVNWDDLREVYRAAYGNDLSLERVQNIFQRSWAIRLALWNGRVVGAVYAFSDGELDASIHGLAVLPEYQKRGIGTALMKSLMESFTDEMAVLLTADEKHWDYYRKLGFRRLQTAMALRFPEKDMEPWNAENGA